MRAIFADVSLLQYWLDAEAALARAEAALGLVPDDAAEEITHKAQAEYFEPSEIKRGVDRTLHPLVPVIRQLAAICDGDAGHYVHWGATTQDIMDTAAVLQMKDGLAVFETTLREFQAVLAGLASEYRDTPMAGRTHGQQALPITFGFKVAIWLAELQRHRERLSQAEARALVGQFGGAVGTLAGLNESGVDALEVQALMMKELGLGVPVIAWHSSRDGIVELIQVLCMLAALCGRIAREIIELQKVEIGELEEPFDTGKVGSSTMPQKRNPMLCEAILTLARLCREKSASALDMLLASEHERDWSAYQMEWALAPEVFIMAQGALKMSCRVLGGLRVDDGRMLENMQVSGGLLLSERVMFALSGRYGRQAAHDLVYDCAMTAFEEKRAFIDVLQGCDEVAAVLSAEELADLLDPRKYTGLAARFVDRVLAEVIPSK